MNDFSKLQTYMDQLHQIKGAPCCDVMVFRHGRPVYRYMTGIAHADTGERVSDKTLYNLYSCSKPITVTAAMQLVEQGRMKLDDPVCRYLPEYADAFYLRDGQRVPVGESMKIVHLFTMSAGLSYSLNNPSIDAARKAYGPDITTRQVVASFVGEPLLFAPGERFQYSLCHDVLAAVVEVVSGQRFGEYLQEHIFDPLDMKDVGFFPTEEQQKRVADQYGGDENQKIVPAGKGIGAFRIARGYESGGAGLFSSTEDYGKFAAAMACGGISADGHRILKAETVDQIRTPQMERYTMNNTFSCAAGAGYAYGLGMRTLISRDEGQRSNIGEFGWDGAAGSYIMMDPAAQLAIVYTQHTIGWNVLFGCMHAPVRDLAYEALGL